MSTRHLVLKTVAGILLGSLLTAGALGVVSELPGLVLLVRAANLQV